MYMYHPVVEKIVSLLKQHAVWFETFEHEPVRTSEEAAKVRTGDYGLKNGTKALIVKVTPKSGEEIYMMLIVSGDKRFDKKKVKAYLQHKDMRFATEEEVTSVTGGVQVGGVPPFGTLFGLRVIVDTSVFDNEKIIFNAGDKRFSIGMLARDFKKIVNPEIADIAQDSV
jgi:prolyl-tRNA editing enzyme YbaK/EbsC (Cys-tRNA(Pro) deacylase)